MTSHMYPVKKPMIRPFLIPQRWAEVKFLSYLESGSGVKLCFHTGVSIAFRREFTAPLLSSLLQRQPRCGWTRAPRRLRLRLWRTPAAPCPLASPQTRGGERNTGEGGDDSKVSKEQILQPHKSLSCFLVFFFFYKSKVAAGKPKQVAPSLTKAMRPAPTPISGLAATMTSVSFQPLTKPMQKPQTKVVKRCRKMATWSAMASLILLMSLERKHRRR